MSLRHGRWFATLAAVALALPRSRTTFTAAPDQLKYCGVPVGERRRSASETDGFPHIA